MSEAKPIVEIKRLRDKDASASDGVEVWHGGKNIVGEDWSDSFRNYDYESSDGYAAAILLRSMEKAGIIKIKAPKSIREAYKKVLE